MELIVEYKLIYQRLTCKCPDKKVDIKFSRRHFSGIIFIAYIHTETTGKSYVLKVFGKTRNQNGPV